MTPGAPESTALPASIRLLFTCVGRRVELVRAFQRAGSELGIDLVLHGADRSALAPALHCLPYRHLVPPIHERRKYIDALLEIVRREHINLLIPLLDLELAVLAHARDRFAACGCDVVVSSPDVVHLCQDKLATCDALKHAGIDTPDTWRWEDVTQSHQQHYPYYLKPRTGSAGHGNYVVRTPDELRTFGLRVPRAIVQEFVEGTEHTLDVFTDRMGVARCAVPRKRLEIRTGEVSKGVTVKDPAIMQVGMDVAAMLGGCRGVITVQCIRTPEGRIRVIEINPRFGGGVPLSIRAGADFPRWLLLEHLGREVVIDPMGFEDDLAMLRFDDSVFVPNAASMVNPADR